MLVFAAVPQPRELSMAFWIILATAAFMAVAGSPAMPQVLRNGNVEDHGSVGSPIPVAGEELPLLLIATGFYGFVAALYCLVWFVQRDRSDSRPP